MYVEDYVCNRINYMALFQFIMANLIKDHKNVNVIIEFIT